MNAKQIKKLRKRLGLTQVEFAKEVGVSFATANRWEQGHFKPLPV
jgi:DNA-binding transcriptional regulator YiaG